MGLARLLYVVIVTFPRDMYGLYIYTKINTWLWYIRARNMTTARYFDINAKSKLQKTCFFYEDEVWTYEKVQNESYKIANYFQDLGYQKGDTIALIMENRPEYVCIWLGLSRIGVITSLINYNVRLKSLEHCVGTSNCKAIIFGTELTEAIQDVIDIGGFKDVDLFSMEDRTPSIKQLSKECTNLSSILETQKSLQKPTVFNGTIDMSDVVLNIFTSGTTGLPKAVLMTHSKVLGYSVGYLSAGVNERDVLITPVPLYHVQGGIVGVTFAIFFGSPQVIIRKFSASKFWDQCIKYNATVGQYLGEIIRYLYSQPEKAVDKLHKVRIFIGNGVNPAIWTKFVERFNNIKIKEFYGSTEGNCNTINLEGHVGACGYLPLWVLPFSPVVFASVDDITGEVLRDPKTGLVKQSAVGEPGEILGVIIENNPLRQFTGYTDREATEKKTIRDVRKKGDLYFRTGDLITRDEFGYMYFKDRSGDTFRWKGENVSTAEVEQVVTNGSGMKGATVYGVPVPGTEGKCGMAAISDPEGTLDLKFLAAEVTRSLPSYARPLFVRVINKDLNMTGTFKLQKMDLQKEGFDLEKKGEDSLYFYKDENYVPLDKELYHDIISGKIRV